MMNVNPAALAGMFPEMSAFAASNHPHAAAFAARPITRRVRAPPPRTPSPPPPRG